MKKLSLKKEGDETALPYAELKKILKDVDAKFEKCMKHYQAKLSKNDKDEQAQKHLDSLNEITGKDSKWKKFKQKLSTGDYAEAGSTDAMATYKACKKAKITIGDKEMTYSDFLKSLKLYRSAKPFLDKLGLGIKLTLDSKPPKPSSGITSALANNDVLKYISAVSSMGKTAKAKRASDVIPLANLVE